ncbi:hypothetical protein HED60_22540 [Planctomycetales bacterium ZRK34]|nr:hypothetical protein HED60_22540 [Planctomycetales bacterium ZRK34]
MMRHYTVMGAIAIFTVACCLLAPAQPPTIETQPPAKGIAPEPDTAGDQLDKMLPSDAQMKLGFHRLTHEERARVSILLQHLVGDSQLNAMAKAYLRKKGWEEVTVSGIQRARLDEFDIERKWIVVVTSLGDKWAIQVPMLWAEPAGPHWGKVGFNGLEAIMDQAGFEYDFIFEKQRRLR